MATSNLFWLQTLFKITSFEERNLYRFGAVMMWLLANMHSEGESKIRRRLQGKLIQNTLCFNNDWQIHMKTQGYTYISDYTKTQVIIIGYYRNK